MLEDFKFKRKRLHISLSLYYNGQRREAATCATSYGRHNSGEGGPGRPPTLGGARCVSLPLRSVDRKVILASSLIMFASSSLRERKKKISRTN